LKFATFSIALSFAYFSLCSCQSKEDRLPFEKKGKTELTAFLTNKIPQYGGNHVVSNTNGHRLDDYVYSEDKDGFQVILPGNRVLEVLQLFTQTLGQPRLSNTNNNGLASFRYSVAQAGVAITCVLGQNPRDRAEFTHIVVVKAEALR
jgi:hypothetical protein